MLEGVRDDLNTALLRAWCGGSSAPTCLTTVYPRSRSPACAPLWVEIMDKLPAVFSGLGLTPQTDIEAEVLEQLRFKASAIDRTPEQRMRGIVGRLSATPPAGPVAIRREGA